MKLEIAQIVALQKSFETIPNSNQFHENQTWKIHFLAFSWAFWQVRGRSNDRKFRFFQCFYEVGFNRLSVTKVEFYKTKRVFLFIFSWRFNWDHFEGQRVICGHIAISGIGATSWTDLGSAWTPLSKTWPGGNRCKKIIQDSSSTVIMLTIILNY